MSIVPQRGVPLITDGCVLGAELGGHLVRIGLTSPGGLQVSAHVPPNIAPETLAALGRFADAAALLFCRQDLVRALDALLLARLAAEVGAEPPCGEWA